MHCQKCGSKVYKRDKYCGHCGKYLIHNDENLDQRNEKSPEDVYKHGLDAVFGYASSPDYKENIIFSESASGDLNEVLDNTIDFSDKPTKESLVRQAINFFAKVFAQPYKLIRSEAVYPASVLWLNIFAVSIVGSIFFIDIFDAAIYPASYLDFLIFISSSFYLDFYYIIIIFDSFFGNMIFLVMIYVLSVIINNLIKLKIEYALFNFRDIIIFSSLAMGISILGVIMFLTEFTIIGYLLNYIGILFYIVSPFLLGIFYVTSGRTNIQVPKLTSVLLVAVAAIVVIIHTYLLFIY